MKGPLQRRTGLRRRSGRASRMQAELAAATLLAIAAGRGPAVAADVDELGDITTDQDAAAVALVAALGAPPDGVTWVDWLTAPWSTASRVVREEARAYAEAAAEIIESWDQRAVDFIARNGDRAVQYAIAQAPAVADTVVAAYETLKPVREDLERAAERVFDEMEKGRDDLFDFGVLGVAGLGLVVLGVLGVAGAYASGPGGLALLARGAARV